MANKVQFGLSNVHFAPITNIGSDGTITYGTVYSIEGAVSLSLDASGDQADFSADNNARYFTDYANNGYTGTLEMAKLSNDFRTKVLGQIIDNNGAILESGEDKLTGFALGFQIDGDESNTRFWLYNCMASRPTLASQTTDTSRTPQTTTLNLTAMRRPKDQRTRIEMTKTDDNTTAYNGFFSTVYEASITTI